ncbi:MAG: GIY-YIG nuclease family protein [Rubrobacteraceae bacterium]|nr:GIY-YIG nuclease family protein [Rubrobacteraceae bacterium]
MKPPKINPSVAELLAAEPDTPAQPAPPPPTALNTPVGRADYWFRRRTGVVYVLQTEPNTPLKIGTALNVELRIKELQTGNAHLLRLIEVIPGGYEMENRIHRALKQERIRGEWFEGYLTSRFLKHLPAYAERAARHHHQTREILPLPSGILPPTLVHRPKPGLKSANFGGNALGHRWRTSTAEKPTLKVRYVEPGADFKRAA